MIKFEHPFTLILAGPTGSGKSTFVIRLLQNLASVCTEQKFAGGIIWCYSEKTAIPTQQLAALHKKITYHEGVPVNFENAEGKPTLIILDDLLHTAYSNQVSILFTRGSHHRNTSVILITQNLFHQNKHSRDISLNAKYLVVLKNVRDKKQFSHLAQQVYPEDSDSLYKAYLDATKKPHGYLVLDLAQKTDDRLRFRTHIFPSKKSTPHVVVYAPVGDETSQVEL
jgi:GTPase SAR1 family protein